MESTDLLLAIAVIAIGSGVQGVVGFGAGMLAAPILVLVDPALVPAPLIVAGLVMNLLYLHRTRDVPAWRPMAPAMGAHVVGAVAAGLVLAALPADALAIGFALMVLVAVALTALGRPVPRSRRTLALGGAASGFLGTTTGVGGPPIALVLTDLDAVALRASLARFFLVGTAVSLATLAVAGRLGTTELGVGLALVPGVLGGYALSGRLARLVEGQHLRAAVLVLSTASALVAVTNVVW